MPYNFDHLCNVDVNPVAPSFREWPYSTLEYETSLKDIWQLNESSQLFFCNGIRKIILKFPSAAKFPFAMIYTWNLTEC